jgi:hypothetical protein
MTQDEILDPEVEIQTLNYYSKMILTREEVTKVINISIHFMIVLK